jgi:transposase
MSKATTQSKVDYFRLPRPLWRKLKKHLPKRMNNSSKRGGRPRVSDRAVANAIWYVLWTGCQWKAIHTAYFSVIDPQRMAHTCGLTDGFVRPGVHASTYA